MPGQCRGRRVLCALVHERACHLPPPWPQGHRDKRPKERLPRNSLAVPITASSRQNPRSPTPVHKPHMITERRGNASPPSLLHCQGQTSFLSAPHPGCYLRLFPHKCLVSSEGLEAAGLGVGRQQATRPRVCPHGASLAGQADSSASIARHLIVRGATAIRRKCRGSGEDGRGRPGNSLPEPWG